MNDPFGVGDQVSWRVGKGLRSENESNSNVELVLYDAFGQVKDRRHVHNAMTTLGKSSIINQCITSPTQAKPSHMEVGTGTNAVGVTLAAYVSGSRTVFDSCTNTAASTSALTMVTTFPAAVGTGALTEAGVFSVVTGNLAGATNPMYCYATFGAINKSLTDALVITWTVTLM